MLPLDQMQEGPDSQVVPHWGAKHTLPFFAKGRTEEEQGWHRKEWEGSGRVWPREQSQGYGLCKEETSSPNHSIHGYPNHQRFLLPSRTCSPAQQHSYSGPSSAPLDSVQQCLQLFHCFSPQHTAQGIPCRLSAKVPEHVAQSPSSLEQS